MSTALSGNFMYPHIVTVRRNMERPAAGQSAYDGLQANAEVVIAGPMLANIQIDRTGRPSEAKLPGDPVGAPTMRIMFQAQTYGGPAYGVIAPRDVIVDGLGNRYQVIVVEWQYLGTEVRAQLLET
jgi:hypothetical protein